MSPRKVISQLIADSLRSQSLFVSVVFNEAGVGTAYVLSGNIERFEEVDEGRDVRAVCSCRYVHIPGTYRLCFEDRLR